MINGSETAVGVGVLFVSDPCPGDFALPVDILKLNGQSGFIVDFSFQNGTRADLAPPFGVYDAADFTAFVEAFLAGCD